MESGAGYHWDGVSFITPHGTEIDFSVECSGRPVVWLIQYPIFETTWKTPAAGQSAPPS